MNDIPQRINDIHRRMDDALRLAGRATNSVRLIAVSKRQPMDRLMAAYEAGLRDFGENYAQSLEARATEMPADVRWHMIGHLQKNKAKKLIGKMAMLHAVDSIKLIDVLGRLSPEPLSVLLQVNIGREVQKSGILPEDIPAILEHLSSQKRVQIKGLMTIPPNDDAPRQWYEKLRILRDELQGQFDLDLTELSMGMSGDFESAILEGATLIRVGTQVFGPRSNG